MKTKTSLSKRFPDAILEALRGSKGLRIRAGMGDHRFIGIWFVMVGDRVFVRSWSVKPNGWYRSFLKEPRGAIKLKEKEVPIGARRIRTAALQTSITRAYLKKYNTPTMLKYARDLGSTKSKATTIELLPLFTRG